MIPFQFSFDAMDADEFLRRFRAHFHHSTILREAQLFGMDGNGVVSISGRWNEVICWNLRLRNSLVTINNQQRLRPDDELFVQIERYDDEPITFYFHTRVKMAD